MGAWQPGWSGKVLFAVPEVPQQGGFRVPGMLFGVTSQTDPVFLQFRVGLTESDWDADDPMTAAKAAWDDERD
ncbi:hypothetical protein SRABI26_03678 [Arthrobacter sp. Bi26]|nr:hypothetical protein SRABI26_03678 [Arthrobacter sp. Bi26]